ncbi:MAG: hypothetical protein ACXWL5_00635 [Candidatus Chromulinivorax sp.]
MMKKFLLVTVVALFLGSVRSLDARNKPSIHVMNEYGKSITVHVTWRNKNFPYDYKSTDVEIRSDKTSKIIKAPISTYDFVNFSVIPSENLKFSALDWAWIGGIGVSLGVAGVGAGVVKYAPEFGKALVVAGSIGGMKGNLIYLSNKVTNEIFVEKVGKVKFFVVKAGKSTLKTDYGKQKKIEIYGYTSEEEYQQSLLVNNVKVDSQIVKGMN